MIIVLFEGQTNEKERGIVESSAEFASRKMFPRHKIFVVFKIIKNLLKNEDVEGDIDYAEYEDDEIRPRNFMIRMQKGMPEEDLRTLVFHELVHVKQIIKKELTYKFDTKNWCYKTYFKGKDVTNVPYFDQPHEKEAYQLQEELLKEFKSEML